MRLHERFPQLWPRYDDAFVSRMVRLQNLVAVRLEPVYSMRFEAFIDAIFESSGEWLVVPFLRTDAVSIMVPENGAVIWPARYIVLAQETIEAIDAEISPWLRSVATARLVNDEHLRYFRDDALLRGQYEFARSKSLLGAAPYPRVLRSVGPAVYALRFARDAHVALRGADAANGAAILSNVAAEIDVEISDFERRWFAGIVMGSIDERREYRCYVGPPELRLPNVPFSVVDGEAGVGERSLSLAEPLPTDVMLSFDLQDAPESRRFAVTEGPLRLQRSVLAEPMPAGNSSGCIRLVVRDDARRFTDADLDAADALAARLNAQGFNAVVSPASTVDVGEADIIHIFGLRHGASVVSLLRDAETRGVPTVVTPFADDRRDESVSGASGSLLIPRVCGDTIMFGDYLWAFAQRRISNLTQEEWYNEASRVIMQRANAAIVCAPSEAAFLRERFTYAGVCVPSAATVPLVAPDDRIASLVGPEEYVLVHGPIESRCNQLFTMLAAQIVNLPLVLLGPIADIEFYRYLNEAMGPTTLQLRDEVLTPAEIAGLYARARVIADVSWSSTGLHRLARGAACGAGILSSSFGYAREVWGDLIDSGDPASPDSIAEGMRTAWDRTPEERSRLAAATAVACDPTASLIAAVTAYQQAAAPISAGN